MIFPHVFLPSAKKGKKRKEEKERHRDATPLSGARPGAGIWHRGGRSQSGSLVSASPQASALWHVFMSLRRTSPHVEQKRGNASKIATWPSATCNLTSWYKNCFARNNGKTFYFSQSFREFWKQSIIRNIVKKTRIRKLRNTRLFSSLQLLQMQAFFSQVDWPMTCFPANSCPGCPQSLGHGIQLGSDS